jgi:hypothetical protein
MPRFLLTCNWRTGLCVQVPKLNGCSEKVSTMPLRRSTEQCVGAAEAAIQGYRGSRRSYRHG